MRRFAIEAQRFEFTMRGDEKRAAGSFVRAARLHANQAIFDDVIRGPRHWLAAISLS